MAFLEVRHHILRIVGAHGDVRHKRAPREGFVSRAEFPSHLCNPRPLGCGSWKRCLCMFPELALLSGGARSPEVRLAAGTTGRRRKWFRNETATRIGDIERIDQEMARLPAPRGRGALSGILTGC